MASTTHARMRRSGSRVKHTVGPGGPWSKLAPAAVTGAYDSPSDAAGWQTWQKHLRERKLPGLSRIANSDESPLAWALPAEGDNEPALALLDWLDELTPGKSGASWEKEASRWLGSADTAVLTPELAIECLAWCWALPALAEHVSESVWWRLLNHLIALPEEAEPTAADASLLARQLILGELPLAMAYLFGELDCAKSLAALGRRNLTDGLRETADGRKVPHARYLADLRLLLACWTRARALSHHMERGWGGVRIDKQLSWVLQAALRLSRADGSPVFSANDAPSWDIDHLALALRLIGAETTQIAKLTSTGRSSARHNKDLPHPSIESEWASLAQLRTNWTPDSPKLTVKYDGPDVELELNAGRRTLWSGSWGIEVSRAGQRLAQVGPWEQICWLSDHEIDYLELSADLAQGVEVERHFVMLRADRVLFMADTILTDCLKTAAERGTVPFCSHDHLTMVPAATSGQSPAALGPPIEYRSTLPLVADCKFVAERETREGVLTHEGKNVARVLPLALPEWRTGRGPGELQAVQKQLELSHGTHAGRLFAPLFVDLNPERLRRQLTWRQLTVAEERQNVTADVATGFRVEIGESQWVVYRSLAPPTVRSLLSKSLLNQFLFGVFSDKGKVEPLVEIESVKE